MQEIADKVGRELPLSFIKNRVERRGGRGLDESQFAHVAKVREGRCPTGGDRQELPNCGGWIHTVIAIANGRALRLEVDASSPWWDGKRLHNGQICDLLIANRDSWNGTPPSLHSILSGSRNQSGYNVANGRSSYRLA
jgi:hypothetical protein